MMLRQLKTHKQRESLFHKVAEVNLLPLFIVLSLATQGIVLAILVGQSFYLSHLAQKGTPTLVELADGTSKRVRAIGSKERTPEALHSFVQTTLTQMFDWTGTLPNPDGVPQPDPGVEIGAGAKKIPTTTWRSGFALAETVTLDGGKEVSFRKPMLMEVAELIPQGLLETGVSVSEKPQGKLVPREIGIPEKIGPGRWKIPLTATLLIFEKGDNIGKSIAFNKTVYVRAIDQPPLSENPSPLERAIYHARKGGMEIYFMQDLLLTD